MEKVQTNSFVYFRVWLPSPPHVIPTTEPAFIEWQSTIGRSLPPPKNLGQKAKSNHWGDSNEPPKSIIRVFYTLMKSCNQLLFRWSKYLAKQFCRVTWKSISHKKLHWFLSIHLKLYNINFPTSSNKSSQGRLPIVENCTKVCIIEAVVISRKFKVLLVKWSNEP